VTWVGVFVDATPDEIRHIGEFVGLDLFQLHGRESPEQLHALGHRAFKASRIGDAEDVALAASYPGDLLLVDAKVAGAMGGTGESFDWTLIDKLVEARRVVLAGGLRSDNVEDAVRRVRPYGVDTASGVESSPGRKDPQKVAAFIKNARRGAAT
jgi:phosphoribosylanthranilate isomerase